MSILKTLENALGRHAELSEYAPEVEAVVKDLAARVERLESFAPASTPEPANPTASQPSPPPAVAGGSPASMPAASPTDGSVPAEQGEPGQV